MDDWYKVTVENFLENRGSLLFAKYGRSRLKLLKKVYPNHPWKQQFDITWKFKYNK